MPKLLGFERSQPFFCLGFWHSDEIFRHSISCSEKNEIEPILACHVRIVLVTLHSRYKIHTLSLLDQWEALGPYVQKIYDNNITWTVLIPFSTYIYRSSDQPDFDKLTIVPTSPRSPLFDKTVMTIVITSRPVFVTVFPLRPRPQTPPRLTSSCPSSLFVCCQLWTQMEIERNVS